MQALYKVDNLLLTYKESEQYKEVKSIIENGDAKIKRASFSPVFQIQEEQKVERAKLTLRLLTGKGKKRTQ